jgi:hypothetical protein
MHLSQFIVHSVYCVAQHESWYVLAWHGATYSEMKIREIRQETLLHSVCNASRLDLLCMITCGESVL